MRFFVASLLLLSSTAFAQTAPADSSATTNSDTAAQTVTVPAGTKLLMRLKSGVNTKSAKPGDGVYLETDFPVSINNTMAIPPGTYVQGIIDNVKRSGRIKGRAEVLFHFTTLIFPNGYTVSVPGSVDNVPGADNGKVINKEGSVQADGTKGKDAGTIAGPAAEGAIIGALARGGKGALIGSGIGGAAGLAEVLFTRGNEINYPAGTPVEMVLQRSLTLDRQRMTQDKTEYVPRQGPTRLEKPRLEPEPAPR
jgi:type IV secretion system protein VirB10